MLLKQSTLNNKSYLYHARSSSKFNFQLNHAKVALSKLISYKL